LTVPAGKNMIAVPVARGHVVAELGVAGATTSRGALKAGVTVPLHLDGRTKSWVGTLRVPPHAVAAAYEIEVTGHDAYLRSSPRARRRYAAVVVLGLLGWSGGTWAASPPAGAPWCQMVAQPGTATISVPYLTVGQPEALTAQGLPKRTAVRLVWQTVQGHWQVDGPTFIGAAYRYGTTVLARAVTTAQSTVHVRFAVPQGFGGPSVGS
jgi:hypothetical protein